MNFKWIFSWKPLWNLLVKLEWRSKILFDTMNLKHVALLNLLHYIGGILQYNSTSANYVRFWVIKCTGYDRPVFIDSSHNVCERHQNLTTQSLTKYQPWKGSLSFVQLWSSDFFLIGEK